MDLLERTAALDALSQVLVRTANGDGSVVLVRGEAGIGKTALLRAALADRPRGVRILAGSCDDLLTARPLGPLRDAALATGGPLEEALAHGDTEAVFGALVDELRRQAPAVLVVEDLQWADEASLDVFAYVVRRIATQPASLIFTLRDDPAVRDHPLFGLLGAGDKEWMHRIALTPLSVQAVASMACGTAWSPQTLHELTAGNPFFISELLAAPREDEFPDTVTAAVMVRVRRLHRPCRAALEQLSVVPNVIDFGLAEAILGPDLVSLAEAEEAGLLDVDGHGISFRHELARRAVERSVSMLRRRVLHSRVTHALLSHGPVPDGARLVHHCINAGDAAGVCRWAPQAGRESAAAGSHRQALAHFEAALQFAEREPAAMGALDRARLWDDYGWELYNAHRFPEAVRAGEQVLNVLSDADAAGVSDEQLAEARAETMVRLARYYVMLGAIDAGQFAARRALDELTESGPPEAVASATTSYASLLALGGETRAAVELDRAERLATEAGRPDLVALCLNYQSIAKRELDADARIDLLQRSVQIALVEGNQEFVARGYTNLVELLYRYNRLADLHTCLEDGLSYTADRGFRSHRYNLEVHRCLLLMKRGEFTAATDGLTRLVGQEEADGVMQIYSRPSLLRLTVRTAGLADGTDLLEIWRSARRHRFLSGLSFAGAALAEWSFLQGRRDVAEQLHEEWQEYADRPGGEAATGEVLRYCARAGVKVIARPDTPMPWVAGINGDWQAAADAWRAVGDRYEQALELIDGDSVDAVLEGLTILDQLAAGPAAHLARRRLKGMGMRAVPRGPILQTRTNPARLTRREVDVLELLVTDRTNAEIADRLVLSVRTVDHHVSAILAKLGVRSREAAKRAADPLLRPADGARS